MAKKRSAPKASGQRSKETKKLARQKAASSQRFHSKICDTGLSKELVVSYEDPQRGPRSIVQDIELRKIASDRRAIELILDEIEDAWLDCDPEDESLNEKHRVLINSVYLLRNLLRESEAASPNEIAASAFRLGRAYERVKLTPLGTHVLRGRSFRRGRGRKLSPEQERMCRELYWKWRDEERKSHHFSCKQVVDWVASKFEVDVSYQTIDRIITER